MGKQQQESIGGVQDTSSALNEPESREPEVGDKPVEASKDADRQGVGGAQESQFVKPLGPSITLHGCGDRSGRDGFNSMGLAEAYRFVVLGRCA